MRQADTSPESNGLIAHLYHRYSINIFKYIYSRIHVREEAEDMLVEVFLVALRYEALSQLSEKQQLAWLITVARNKVVDWYRRTNRYPGTSLELLSDVMLDTVSERLPEHIVLKGEEYAQLQRQISRLPEIQQEVLRLRFIVGLRSAEIATIIGKTEGAVHAALWRAIRSLRTLYQVEEDKSKHGAF